MANKLIQNLTILIITLFISGVFVLPVFASTTDGAIDSALKYAWGENTDWVNFGCSNCNVHITDSGLTGYAWSENYGWINLNPTQSGVKNNGEGNLSGSAWAENLGFIDFNGVGINYSGEFSGLASGGVSGQISFNCTDCRVKTDWRPKCNNGIDDDADGKTDYPDDPGCNSYGDGSEDSDAKGVGSGPSGGGILAEGYSPLTPPAEGFAIFVNNNEEYTASPITTLILRGGPNTERMAISNFSDFRDAGQETYTQIKSWDLCQGFASCPEGEYAVYAKFYASLGKSSEAVSDSIIYSKETILGKIIALVPSILQPFIPEFLKPKPPEVAPPAVSLEKLVPKQAPLAMSGKWKLLTYTILNKPMLAFTETPLPKQIRELAEKFPELGETFKKVGITKITDVEKLKTVKLTLPGLTEKLGLPMARVEPGRFVLPEGVPVAKLSPQAKQQLPTEIVFAKTGRELIDFNIALTVSEKGEPQQKISTVSGKPLQLAVKPDKPVKSVKGYVVFKSKSPRPTSFQFPFNSLTASLIFANPVFAKQQEKPVRVEEKLVLLEFEYTDPDGDGIYTAEIQAPVIEGEYEIITVMDFEDPELGKKEIRLTTVVDPEGYVYEKDGAKETRVPGAIVSFFWLNPEIKQYELWPAKEYQQENPQTTDVRGTYSFLVPEGFYYLKVEAPGYLVYDGKPFQVKEGSGVHINIELKTRYWWLKVVDWKTVLLIAFILLLLYNFYKDKIREKLTSNK